ncbi:hypothetical protein [Streptomyces avermitilis]|uniref:hypothetical protein n=1 Tax=Streptomyces avermitilis TaxID=33903 RepID=UPI003805C868
MTVDDCLTVLVGVTALRVFAPDARKVTRLLLRTGVRVGARELLQSSPHTPASVPTAARDGEG